MAPFKALVPNGPHRIVRWPSLFTRQLTQPHPRRQVATALKGSAAVERQKHRSVEPNQRWSQGKEGSLERKNHGFLGKTQRRAPCAHPAALGDLSGEKRAVSNGPHAASSSMAQHAKKLRQRTHDLGRRRQRQFSHGASMGAGLQLKNRSSRRKAASLSSIPVPLSGILCDAAPARVPFLSPRARGTSSSLAVATQFFLPPSPRVSKGHTEEVTAAACAPEKTRPAAGLHVCLPELLDHFGAQQSVVRGVFQEEVTPGVPPERNGVMSGNWTV
ncbi:hypothetical protein HPB51_011444 [Rhipicephalus microplus]|uniref:Uncharacterized protein n=1 Tax=Rhipicephalus microplus TaxID=6941 RepID=A0A9J6EH81_RHIMP|nr:hypothetical protein HPB51_011444 [Rhipicephalus microplus]